MKSTNFPNAILLILIVGIFLIGCKYFGDPIIGAKGKIKDTVGNPVEGVAVSIEKPGFTPHKEMTKADGLYEVSLIGADPSKTKISFAKEGYKTVEKKFEKEGIENFDVTLETAAK